MSGGAQNKPKKKPPERKCNGCGAKKAKNELIRVVRAPEGGVSLDFKGKSAGRGAYICKNASCLTKARKARRLERSLKCEIPAEVYDLLIEELSKHE